MRETSMTTGRRSLSVGLRAFVAPTTLVLLAVLGAGCSEEEMVQPARPLQATASLLELNDGTGPYALAQIIVVSTESGTPEFVENTTTATVTYGEAEVDLADQRVRLRGEPGAQVETTFHRATSRQNNQLAYVRGETYTFTFSVASGGFASETHQMTITTPDIDDTVERVSDPTPNEKLDIVTSERFEAGIVQVVRAGSSQTTWTSYPFDENSLTSAAEVIERRTDLEQLKGGIVTVPAEAFKRSGTHEVTFIGVHVDDSPAAISAGLGDQSVIFAGSASTLTVNIP